MSQDQFNFVFILSLLVFIQCFCTIVEGNESTFRYLTSYNKNGRFLKKEDLERSTINVLKPVIFVISGVDNNTAKTYTGTSDLVDQYLQKQIHNVFLVEWRFDPKSPRTRSVGLTLADFISAIFTKTGESSLNIHLVGVLAGARVAAIAGKRVPELTGRKVNRITALDPAYYLINDGNVKLDGTNANFVEVVESGEGEGEDVGHARFYVDDRNCGGVGDFGGLTAAKVFANSINSNKFKAVKCESVKKFEDEKCGGGNGDVVFGEDVDLNARGDYVVAAC